MVVSMGLKLVFSWKKFCCHGACGGLWYATDVEWSSLVPKGGRVGLVVQFRSTLSHH